MYLSSSVFFGVLHAPRLRLVSPISGLLAWWIRLGVHFGAVQGTQIPGVPRDVQQARSAEAAL